MRLRTLCLLLILAASAEGAKETSSVAASLPTDLVVEIRHLDGTVEKFGREVALMEIILGPASTIQYVHLILVTGAEKDTHAWYNYEQIAGFRYQFTAITGKGKVKIKQLGRFPVAEQTGLKESIPLLEVDDFK